MSRIKVIGALSIVAVIVTVVILFIIGGVNPADFSTQLAVGLALLIPVIIVFIFKPEIDSWVESRREPSEQIISPILRYGKVIVRKITLPTHGGVCESKNYHVEIINTTPNTVAKNCTGSIDIPGTEIRNHVTMWEKDRKEIINIGHTELLHLFRVSVFSKELQLPEIRLYFYSRAGIDHIDRAAEERYTNNLNKKLTTLIQSENAHFPSESDSFSKTICQIINEAVEE